MEFICTNQSQLSLNILVNRGKSDGILYLSLFFFKKSHQINDETFHLIDLKS